ncbi:MAG: amidase, partial [Quisquiliibacterium sp.]
MTEIPLTADATELAELIARGELSAAQALEDSLQRAAQLNPLINALCLQRPEQARQLAAGIDELLVHARRTPGAIDSLRRVRPFLGVPTVLKDTGTAALGLPSMQGSRLFGEIQWPFDSELVRRYRHAGLVPFARTTSPELAISPSTEALAYGGPTRNPWNLEASPGGSSGGAAAALAARIVRIAHGTDGAGSIRIPAACCAVVGLKPTRGLVPMGPLAGEGWGGLLVEHMLTLSVRDCAAALDASAGTDIGAPYSAPPYAQALPGVQRVLAGGKPKLMRVAVMDTTLEGDT